MVDCGKAVQRVEGSVACIYQSKSAVQGSRTVVRVSLVPRDWSSEGVLTVAAQCRSNCFLRPSSYEVARKLCPRRSAVCSFGVRPSDVWIQEGVQMGGRGWFASQRLSEVANFWHVANLMFLCDVARS